MAERATLMLFEYTTNGGTTYNMLAGFRSRRFRLGRDIIDVTTMDTLNLHRKLMSGGGVLQISLSGDGVFEDAASQAAMEAKARSGEPMDLRVTIPSQRLGSTVGLETTGLARWYTGPFNISDWEFGGDHNTELTFSATFESAGDGTVAMQPAT